MSLFSIQYGYWAYSSHHQRHPRVDSTSSGFAAFSSQQFPNLQTVSYDLTSGSSFPIHLAFPTLVSEDGKSKYKLFFINVTGLVEGSVTVDANASAEVMNNVGTVGDSPVSQLVVYVPVNVEGIGSGGDPGICIDAFDEDEQKLIDDIFVTVKVNNTVDQKLTDSGNIYGYVGNTADGVVITASTHIQPTDVNFIEWSVPTDDKPLDLPDANLPANKGASALAMYSGVKNKQPKFADIHIDPRKRIFENNIPNVGIYERDAEKIREATSQMKGQAGSPFIKEGDRSGGLGQRGGGINIPGKS